MTHPPRRLVDLDPRWVRHWADGDREGTQEVASLSEAQGIKFTCPLCLDHRVICWSRSRGVPDGVRPGPGRWRLDGAGFEDLSLNAEKEGGARSVAIDDDWHGFITNGQAISA